MLLPASKLANFCVSSNGAKCLKRSFREGEILFTCREGNICVNLKTHFHPVYHLGFMNDLDSNAVAEFTVTSDAPKESLIIPDSTTCWNWAQHASKDTWDLIGLGGPEIHPRSCVCV